MVGGNGTAGAGGGSWTARKGGGGAAHKAFAPALLRGLIWVLHHPPHQLLEVRHGGRRPLVPGEGAACDWDQAREVQWVRAAVVHERRGAGPVRRDHCNRGGT